MHLTNIFGELGLDNYDSQACARCKLPALLLKHNFKCLCKAASAAAGEGRGKQLTATWPCCCFALLYDKSKVAESLLGSPLQALVGVSSLAECCLAFKASDVDDVSKLCLVVWSPHIG